MSTNPLSTASRATGDPTLTGRNEGVARLRSHELTLEELLAASIVRQVMQRDGADPQYVRELIATVARAVAESP